MFHSFSRLLAIFIAAVSLSAVAFGQASISPVSLTCEYHANPLGIHTAAPRLSWKLASTEAGARGQVQTAYEIQAAATQEALEQGDPLLWATGRVESNETLHLPWGGDALESRDRVYWHVRVWDAAGEASPWSSVAHFTVGLLETGAWSAEWIGIDDDVLEPEPVAGEWIWAGGGDPATSAAPGTVYLRHVLPLDGARELVSACLYVSADNWAGVYVNGQRVGTVHGFHAANEVIVPAGLLVPGNNVIAMEATNAGEAPNPAGLMAVAVLTFADGGTSRTVTSGEWRGATQAAEGWMLPAFDDAGWAAADVLGANGIGPWNTVTLPHDRRLPARHLRTEFDAEQPVVRATAYATGLGYYEMYINGEKVSDRVLEPAVSDYRDHVLYGTFDVTAMLREGRNALGAIVGNGHFFAPRVSVPAPTLDFGLPRFIGQLEIEYADGTVARVVTNEAWKVTDNGPIRENNIYDGEVYDATMDLGAWAEPAYDDSAWQAADRMESPGGVLYPQMIEPHRVTLTLQPATVEEVSPGVHVFDMGQNMVGWIRLRVQGPAGTRVQLRHAEVRNSDGTLNVANMRGAKVTNTYVLRGEGVEEYAPRFTYQGFRYVEVRGWPGTPTRDDLVGEVVHTDMTHHGRFACSNDLINAIKRNLDWGVRGNVRGMPTDCPQRDERQGWLGDIATESKAQSYDFMNASFYRKWLGDIRDAQNDAGSIPDVAPPFWTLHNDNITWPGTYVIVPGWYTGQYGDPQLVENHYATMRKWVLYMAQFLEDGIMPRDTYGDWCVPPEREELIHSEDPARKTAGPVLGTAYYYHILTLMEGFAKDLGKNRDAREFGKMAAASRDAFIRDFYNEESHDFANGTQTASLLALHFGLVPEDDREAIAARLAKKIMEEANGHIATGLVGGQWLMRTLCDHGYGDVAYTIATQDTYPSWGYMVRNGATTLWELWNGNTADPAMNSHNHLMLSGDFGLWLYEYLAGIRNAKDSAAFGQIEIRPYVLGDLTWVEAETETLRGRIAVRWERTDEKFTLNVTIPPNTTAEVALPTLEWDAPIVREGEVVIHGEGAGEVSGTGGVRVEEDRVVVSCAPGAYVFTVSGG
jgi:alpha-L-rhamnosidase